MDVTKILKHYCIITNNVKNCLGIRSNIFEATIFEVKSRTIQVVVGGGGGGVRNRASSFISVNQ